MKNLQLFFVTSFVIALLTGCEALRGKEVARLPVNQISVDSNHRFIQEATLELKKGDKVNIWSEMDMAYEGKVKLQFNIEVQKNKQNMGVLMIDPTRKSLTMGEIKTVFNNKTDWSFSGKNSEFHVEEDASYTFRAILIASPNPTLKIKKAEVVLKK
jgi:hypothetical protein